VENIFAYPIKSTTFALIKLKNGIAECRKYNAAKSVEINQEG
jgi:hypothetical protein